MNKFLFEKILKSSDPKNEVIIVLNCGLLVRSVLENVELINGFFGLNQYICVKGEKHNIQDPEDFYDQTTTVKQTTAQIFYYFKLKNIQCVEIIELTCDENEIKIIKQLEEENSDIDDDDDDDEK